MTNNFRAKAVIGLAVFLSALFSGLKAEPIPGSVDEVKIEDIAKKVYPSVVKVEARNRIRVFATGVVIDKDGYIVTTALISPRDEKISVITSEGKRIEANFLGMDPDSHLALIQAKDKNLIPISMGSTKDISPGSLIAVVSISPEDTPAVTQGIVSSIAEDKLRLNVWVVRGASGSPVVDRNGRLVGLLRGVYYEDNPVMFEFREKELAGSGFVLSKAEAPSSGLALAIPVEIVRKVASEIKEKGKVERGWLGVRIMDRDEGGVIIAEIDRESPAELAGLKRGDVILDFEGKKVANKEMLGDEIKKRKPGESVTLKLERDGKEIEIKAKLGEASEEELKRELEQKFPRLFLPRTVGPLLRPKSLETRGFNLGFEKRKYVGVTLEEINRELSEYFGLKEGKGLLVLKIKEGGPAEKAGLRVGDVIVEAEGKRLERMEEFTESIMNKNKGDKIKLGFFRDRKKMSVEVEVEEEETERIPFEFGPSLKDWEDYADSWGKYWENLKRQRKDWQDYYSGEYKRQMERLKEQIEEMTLKREEAAKKLMTIIGIKV